MKAFFRHYVLIPSIVTVAVFVLMCVLGYFGFSLKIDAAQEIMRQFAEMIDQKGIISDSGDIKVAALFLNNWKASGISLILGFVPFLFLPVFVLLTNSAVTGGVFAVMSASGGNILMGIVTGILPHGIFEIPALCISIAMGFQLCRFICSKILDRGRLNSLSAGTFFLNTAKVFVFIVTPMLIIAALVETYITPVIMGLA